MLLTFTSNLALDWNIVCALWHSWANAALRAVIFCRPSYVSSHWSGSISPSSKSRSTNALSNSFSNISSHLNANDTVAITEISETDTPTIIAVSNSNHCKGKENKAEYGRRRNVSIPIKQAVREGATIWPGPLQADLWPWKWCPSHVWRGLPLC